MNARGYLDWDNFRFAPAVPPQDKDVRANSLTTGEPLLRPQDEPRLFDDGSIEIFAAPHTPKQH